MRLLYTWLALLAPALPGASLEAEIQSIIENEPAARHAAWGIEVAEARSGRRLFQLNADSHFIPASTVKLFVSALALTRLGPDYRFETLVTAPEAPDAEGRISGDVTLVGKGDPTVSGRQFPYRKGPATGNPLAPLEDLADQMLARGVRIIEGDIVGDDSAYVWEPYADGWSQDDLLWDYGAPVSALPFNESAIAVTVQPAAVEGQPPSIFFAFPPTTLELVNRITTAAGGPSRLFVHRLPGSGARVLWGSLSKTSPPQKLNLALDDPALTAASLFAGALRRRGIQITGQARARHLMPWERPGPGEAAGMPPPATSVVARRLSPPLLELLRVLNKDSNNLYAEVVLREVGRTRRNAGTAAAGLLELEAFLTACGIPAGSYSFDDGSGLSRRNLASPSAVTALLACMHRSDYRADWISTLAAAAQDGTLESRFRNSPGSGRIRAKTGALAHSSALSGYVLGEVDGGEDVVFSILVNNHTARSAQVRAVIDRIVVAILGPGN